MRPTASHKFGSAKSESGGTEMNSASKPSGKNCGFIPYSSMINLSTPRYGIEWLLIADLLGLVQEFGLRPISITSPTTRLLIRKPVTLSLALSNSAARRRRSCRTSCTPWAGRTMAPPRHPATARRRARRHGDIASRRSRASARRDGACCRATAARPCLTLARNDSDSRASRSDRACRLGSRASIAASLLKSYSRIRSKILPTCTAVHLPPHIVGMPRSLSPAAIARNDMAPPAWSSVITGARSAALALACAVRTNALIALASSV